MARRKFDWNTVTEQIKSQDKPKSFNNAADEGLFKAQVNSDGNANILMRFLPPAPGEELPFVKKYNHGFQGVNGWFIEDCPTSIGKPCPVCKYNQTIWGSNETQARNQKRKVSFYANILVIQDENHPENNGKVFKYRYGIKIHEKIMEKLAPESSIDEPVQVFDFDHGANFKLKIKTVKSGPRSYPNYDSSSFNESSAISLGNGALTDDEIEEIDAKLFRLNPIVDKENFKSYNDLATKLGSKIGEFIPQEGETAPAPKITAPVIEEHQAQSFEPPKQTEVKVDNFLNKDEEEDDDDFFKKLKGAG